MTRWRDHLGVYHGPAATPLTPAGQALLKECDDMDWPMLPSVIAAIERQAADRALAELRREVQLLDWEGCGGWGCEDNMSGTLEAVLALIDKASKPEEGL